MESLYNPWATVEFIKESKERSATKSVPLSISLLTGGCDNTVIITKPDRDTARSELIQMARTHGKIHLIHAPHKELARYALSPLKLLSIPKDEAIYFMLKLYVSQGTPIINGLFVPVKGTLSFNRSTHMLNSCFMRSSIFREHRVVFPEIAVSSLPN
ncbi:hypothetical protein H5410_027441 [Solanum commersonii]|uniref:Uncharacterized protein n=1 Tax=Solanum commersonii TaxID=4109 RepID=A0A9J5Z1A1_SOLCO|nr:hypothetical protein H5410_027441 [Solanum commersonii]